MANQYTNPIIIESELLWATAIQDLYGINLQEVITSQLA